MKSETLLKVMFVPCFALATCVALGGVAEDFEDDTKSGEWTGDWNIASESVTAPSAGSPKIDNAGHEKVLSFQGEVVCASAPSATDTSLDFLLNVSEAFIEKGPTLENLPTDMGAKIALALDDDATWCVYCQDGSQNKWIDTGVMAENSAWVRVTMTLENSKYGISINGIPLVSSAGYLKSSDTPKNERTQGSWYTPVASDTGTGSAAVSFAGVAKVDNFVIKTYTKTDPKYEPTATATITIVPSSEDGSTQEVTESVTLTELETWGVSPESAQTTVIDNSGLTVAESLELGYEPGRNTKFEAVEMGLTETTDEAGEGSSTTQYAIFKIPAPTRKSAENVKYSIVVYDGAGEVVDLDDNAVTTMSGDTGSADEDRKLIKLDMSKISSDSEVLKFKLKASR